MTQIIGTRHKLDRTLTDLEALRRRYAAGEKTLSRQILDSGRRPDPCGERSDI